MASQDKNINNVAGGLKATVNNPKVSDEAKESAKQRLSELGTEAGSDVKPKDQGIGITDADLSSGGSEGRHSNVMGGYKATLKNPKVGQEAKDKAQQILDDNNESI